jgi:hypothetical protein
MLEHVRQSRNVSIHKIFISSTYKDLIEERKEVVLAILRFKCLPVGMELFRVSE